MSDGALRSAGLNPFQDKKSWVKGDHAFGSIHDASANGSSSSAAMIDSSAAMAEQAYGRNFDVFLNHRGPDVKDTFVAHLHDALQSAGLNPFLDKKSLVKGSSAFTSIATALESARVHVAVVSRGYAESKYCLSELVAMMRSCKPVIAVFYDVEPAQVRRVETGPFAAAFEKHMSRESAEQVEEWADALEKLANITNFCFRLSDYQGDEGDLKHEVVDGILSLMPAHGHECLEPDHHLVGVEVHLNTCINKLDQMFGATRLLGLVGMGGIGKTTLAKEIYNHFVGCKMFQAMSFLAIDNVPSGIEVGSSSLSRLQRQLLWDLIRVQENDMQRYEYWFHKLARQGPVLIVLDDIHDKTQFDKLILSSSLLARGSCIIVTSRNHHLLEELVVGGKMQYYLHEVTPLGCDDSQKLLNLHAFHNEEAPVRLKKLANDVSKACGGLPLALKVVGSSLFDKRSDEDLEYIWVEAVDAIWEDHDIMGALKWSYDCLSTPEKLMFVDIACLFYGSQKPKALEIWKSCKEYSSCCGVRKPNISLSCLIDKSLVDIEKFEGEDILVMHGLLQDMGQRIGRSNRSQLWDNRGSSVELEEHIEQCLKYADLFGQLTSLAYANFQGCKKLQSIGESFGYSGHHEPLNLLKLNLDKCTSIPRLPNYLRHFYWLQVLDLCRCRNLWKLPILPIQILGSIRIVLFGLQGQIQEIISENSSLILQPTNVVSMANNDDIVERIVSVVNMVNSIAYIGRLDVKMANVASMQEVDGNSIKKGVCISSCSDEKICSLLTSKVIMYQSQSPLEIKLVNDISSMGDVVHHHSFRNSDNLSYNELQQEQRTNFENDTPKTTKMPLSFLDQEVSSSESLMDYKLEEVTGDNFVGRVKRRRKPNWSIQEKQAFLELKVEALEVVEGEDWAFISQGLHRRHGFERSYKCCMGLWGTMRKHLHAILAYESNNGMSYWEMNEDEKSKNKLPRIFFPEWWKMMDTILVAQRKRSRKENRENFLPNIRRCREYSLSYLRNPLRGKSSEQFQSKRPRMTDQEESALGIWLFPEQKSNLTWKYGSMFRPPLFSRTLSNSKDHSSINCIAHKPYFKDYPSTILLTQIWNYINQLYPIDQDNDGATFPMASCEEFFCIQGLVDIGNGFKRPLLIVYNPFEEKVIQTLSIDHEYNISLMHMRALDDSSHFKLLLAGSSYTKEYDSKTNSWKQEENQEFPGTLKELFQNGTYYKDSRVFNDQEYLFCISSAIDNLRRVLMYDFKRKSWSKCQVPQMTVVGSNVEPINPISIEEYGKIIFLFSEQKCGKHEYILIHRLINLDAVGNAIWRQIIKKKRNLVVNTFKQQEFLVYPNTIYTPSSDEIAETGGCLFVFTINKDSKALCIYELDCRGQNSWSHVKSMALRTKFMESCEKYGSLLHS